MKQYFLFNWIHLIYSIKFHNCFTIRKAHIHAYICMYVIMSKDVHTNRQKHINHIKLNWIALRQFNNRYNQTQKTHTKAQKTKKKNYYKLIILFRIYYTYHICMYVHIYYYISVCKFTHSHISMYLLMTYILYLHNKT